MVYDIMVYDIMVYGIMVYDIIVYGIRYDIMIYNIMVCDIMVYKKQSRKKTTYKSVVDVYPLYCGGNLFINAYSLEKQS